MLNIVKTFYICMMYFFTFKSALFVSSGYFQEDYGGVQAQLEDGYVAGEVHVGVVVVQDPGGYADQASDDA